MTSALPDWREAAHTRLSGPGGAPAWAWPALDAASSQTAGTWRISELAGSSRPPCAISIHRGPKAVSRTRRAEIGAAISALTLADQGLGCPGVLQPQLSAVCDRARHRQVMRHDLTSAHTVAHLTRCTPIPAHGLSPRRRKVLLANDPSAEPRPEVAREQPRSRSIRSPSGTPMPSSQRDTLGRPAPSTQPTSAAVSSWVSRKARSAGPSAGLSVR